MSTPLFEEIAPWYRVVVSRFVLVAFRIPEELRDRILATPEAQARGLSEFMRAAIAEKLGLPPEKFVAPSPSSAPSQAQAGEEIPLPFNPST